MGVKEKKSWILTIRDDSNIECVLEKKIENNIVPDARSKCVPETNILKSESEVNDKENNVES